MMRVILCVRDAHAVNILFNNTKKNYMGSKASNHIPIHFTRTIFNILAVALPSAAPKLFAMKCCFYEYHQYIILSQCLCHLTLAHRTSHIAQSKQANARNIYGNSKACMCLRQVLCVILYLKKSKWNKRKQISCDACGLCVMNVDYIDLINANIWWKNDKLHCDYELAARFFNEPHSNSNWNDDNDRQIRWIKPFDFDCGAIAFAIDCVRMGKMS